MCAIPQTHVSRFTFVDLFLPFLCFIFLVATVTILTILEKFTQTELWNGSRLAGHKIRSIFNGDWKCWQNVFEWILKSIHSFHDKITLIYALSPFEMTVCFAFAIRARAHTQHISYARLYVMMKQKWPNNGEKRTWSESFALLIAGVEMLNIY